MVSTPIRRMVIVVLLGFLAVSCTDIERRAIRLTPTATAEPGVRVIVDNCPGPSIVSLSVRDELLWQVNDPGSSAATVQEDSAATVQEDSETTESPVDDDLALLELRVGETPAGWTLDQALEQPLREGVRYTVQTQPDGQSIDFSIPDLASGLLFDGQGRRQFNPGLLEEQCEAQADLAGFTKDIGILAALSVTFAAFTLVAIITVLFVITRGFSRIRSIERRVAKEANPVG